ncbi:MAG: hypothetical protein MI799_23875 [Desulfobacterales bacterium]|nr:hypothetical protein [Desulfobacterales bacterium]
MGKNILLLIICLVLICACGPDKEKMVQEEKNSLESITGQISNDFLIIKNCLKDLAGQITVLYENQDQYDYESHREKYGLSPQGVLYKLEDDGGAAVFVSGVIPVDNRIKRIVAFTSPLDETFKKIIKELPSVVQVYYNDEYSYNRIYPFFEVLSQYEPGMDIPGFNFYYLADQEHNPDKKVVWVDEPYVDPAGRGWMISAIAPVYYNDRLAGVPGMDITVNKIIDKYLDGHPSVFILDKTGVLVAVNHKLVHLLSLPPLENHEYLETIKSDKYRKNDFNLLKSKERTIREMAIAIISGQKKDYAFSIDEKDYRAVSVAMSELGWTLVSILEL